MRWRVSAHYRCSGDGAGNSAPRRKKLSSFRTMMAPGGQLGCEHQVVVGNLVGRLGRPAGVRQAGAEGE
jgi:hypothetical protein